MANGVDALQKISAEAAARGSRAGLRRRAKNPVDYDPDTPPAGRAGARERILIYRIGSLGDTAVALPCFHKLAQVFPEAERFVLTNVPVSSKAAALELILGGSGLIHGVVNYPLNLRSVTEAWRLSRELRALGATTLIYLTPRLNRLLVLRDMLFFRLSGLRRIIAAPLADDVQTVTYDAQGLREFECVRLARSLRALGAIDLDDPANWDLKLTPQELEAGDRAVACFAGAPFIAVNMGGKVIEKHWGANNWRAFLADLAPTHGGYGLLFLGAGDEAQEVDRVAAEWPGEVCNACGALLPRESAAALRRASLFVGHDSGPMHLAAAAGVTCVSPFGSLNEPRKWHPYGEGHRIIHKLEGVGHVTVAEMTTEVRAALPARRAAGPALKLFGARS